MRVPLALAAAVAALALGACGGDDDKAETTGTTTTTTATTEAAPTQTTPDTGGESPPFSPTQTFSGDEVIACLKKEGQAAERETDPPADDKAGQGVVHDRVLVGGGAGDPALRLFMFAAADLAEREGKVVTERSPDAQVLGTTILEPLAGSATEETEAVIGCLKKQAG